MKFNLKLQRKKKNEAFVAHFRLLGLRRGECRSNVIRSAAQAMSVALNYCEDHYAGNFVQQSADDVRRAKIAVATYRLLDPRERADLYERVQLCYPIDRDNMDLPASTGKLIDQMPKLPPNNHRPSISIVKPVARKVSKEANEGIVPNDTEPEAANVNHAHKKSGSELSLEERRNLVRLMQESEESMLRGLAPLGWLRSRLGI